MCGETEYVTIRWAADSYFCFEWGSVSQNGFLLLLEFILREWILISLRIVEICIFILMLKKGIIQVIKITLFTDNSQLNDFFCRIRL